MHRTAIRLLTTAAAVAALALPTHASWTAPADAATRRQVGRARTSTPRAPPARTSTTRPTWSS